MQGGFRELAGQRVRDEWFKWAERSAAPSAGLKFLAATGWVGHFPEIQSLIGTPQDPEWHPEGDVFIHTGHCCDALAGLANGSRPARSRAASICWRPWPMILASRPPRARR